MDKISAMKKGVRILEKSFFDLLKFIQIDQNEKEVAQYLKLRTRFHGAKKIAFRFIVATGLSAAEPHHRLGVRKLKRGDMVVIDFGVKVSGYCTDMTRTIFLEKPNPKQKKIYEIILKAQTKAISKVKNGIPAKEVDQAARSYISQKGFKKYFIHKSGHGVGKRIHEAPRLSLTNNRRLKMNQVITVEPGIYIPRWGGVRIEDMVLITSRGSRVLTKKIPKTLSEIIIL